MSCCCRFPSILRNAQRELDLPQQYQYLTNATSKAKVSTMTDLYRACFHGNRTFVLCSSTPAGAGAWQQSAWSSGKPSYGGASPASALSPLLPSPYPRAPPPKPSTPGAIPHISPAPQPGAAHSSWAVAEQPSPAPIHASVPPPWSSTASPLPPQQWGHGLPPTAVPPSQPSGAWKPSEAPQQQHYPSTSPLLQAATAAAAAPFPRKTPTPPHASAMQPPTPLALPPPSPATPLMPSFYGMPSGALTSTHFPPESKAAPLSGTTAHSHSQEGKSSHRLPLFDALTAKAGHIEDTQPPQHGGSLPSKPAEERKEDGSNEATGRGGSGRVSDPPQAKEGTSTLGAGKDTPTKLPKHRTFGAQATWATGSKGARSPTLFLHSIDKSCPFGSIKVCWLSLAWLLLFRSPCWPSLSPLCLWGFLLPSLQVDHRGLNVSSEYIKDGSTVEVVMERVDERTPKHTTTARSTTTSDVYHMLTLKAKPGITETQERFEGKLRFIYPRKWVVDLAPTSGTFQGIRCVQFASMRSWANSSALVPQRDDGASVTLLLLQKMKATTRRNEFRWASTSPYWYAYHVLRKPPATDSSMR